MTIQTPTRITIEIQPGAQGTEADSGGRPAEPIIRVLPITVGAQPNEFRLPAAYAPGPCTCLDDEDCGIDHGND